MACAAGLIAAGYAGGRHVATSERFAIAEVELRGASRVSPAELRARLGDLGGQNIFGASTARAERRVEAHPWVESARVRRDLPNRLDVRVREREPAGVVHLDGLYLVDARGDPFVRARAGAREKEALPVITGLDRRAFRRDPEDGRARIREALAAAETYAEGDRPRLGEIRIGRGGRLVFTTYEDAVEVRTPARSAEELGAWLRGFDAARAALSERERQTARVFRVEGIGDPERVTVDFSGRGAHR